MRVTNENKQTNKQTECSSDHHKPPHVAHDSVFLPAAGKSLTGCEKHFSTYSNNMYNVHPGRQNKCPDWLVYSFRIKAAMINSMEVWYE